MSQVPHHPSLAGHGRIVAMGTSNDADVLAPYGVTETEIALAALDGVSYAADKAGGYRERFAVELVGEFELALYEAMGIRPPGD